MPIPFMVAAGAAALAGAAFGIGRYSRQGEINELKSQVIQLQDALERYEERLKSQLQTIRELKAHNKSLNALYFMEKRKLNARTKGLLIFQYAFKEYFELVRKEADQKLKSDDPEHVIYDILDRLFGNKEVLLEEKGLIKVYIEQKYPYQIKNLIPYEINELSVALGVS